MAIKEKDFKRLAGDSFCCKKNFTLECHSRYASHVIDTYIDNLNLK